MLGFAPLSEGPLNDSAEDLVVSIQNQTYDIAYPSVLGSYVTLTVDYVGLHVDSPFAIPGLSGLAVGDQILYEPTTDYGHAVTINSDGSVVITGAEADPNPQTITYAVVDASNGYSKSGNDTVVMAATYVVKQTTFTWDRNQEVSKQLTFTWDALNEVIKQTGFYWNLNNEVVKSSNFTWDLINEVTKQTIFTWNTSGGVVKQVTFSYHINPTIEIIKKSNFSWDLLQQVVKQTPFIWSVDSDIKRTAMHIMRIQRPSYVLKVVANERTMKVLNR